MEQNMHRRVWVGFRMQVGLRFRKIGVYEVLLTSKP